MTAVVTSLPAATSRGEHTQIRGNTRNPAVAEAANAYLVDPSSTKMTRFLDTLIALPAVHVIRTDLCNRMTGVLHKHILHPELTLVQAAELYHSEFRYKGRPVGRRRLIGTTLLVKGLEFDHAIVLDATSLVLALFTVGDVYASLCKKALTLHLACSEGRERYLGCNLMHRKVLVSSHQHLMAEAPLGDPPSLNTVDPEDKAEPAVPATAELLRWVLIKIKVLSSPNAKCFTPNP